MTMYFTPVEYNHPSQTDMYQQKRQRVNMNGYSQMPYGGNGMLASGDSHFEQPHLPVGASAPYPSGPMSHNSFHQPAFPAANTYPPLSFVYGYPAPVQTSPMPYQPTPSPVAWSSSSMSSTSSSKGNAYGYNGNGMSSSSQGTMRSGSASHNKAGERRFRCMQPGCGNIYRSQEQLYKHQATSHTKPRPYHCSKCHRSFAERGNLKKHEKSVHNGEREKICPYDGCGRRFAFNDGLSRHIKNVHQQLRPYSCPCGKKFKQLSHLKKHSNSKICAAA